MLRGLWCLVVVVALHCGASETDVELTVTKTSSQSSTTQADFNNFVITDNLMATSTPPSQEGFRSVFAKLDGDQKSLLNRISMRNSVEKLIELAKSLKVETRHVENSTESIKLESGTTMSTEPSTTSISSSTKPISTSQVTEAPKHNALAKSDKNISLMGKNYTIMNVTEYNESIDAFHHMDNYAKEIILLSTAFATMLLSICFLIFIIWFCYFTMAREKRRAKIDSKFYKQAEKETQLNLAIAGVQAMKMHPINTTKRIQVRDEKEEKTSGPSFAVYYECDNQSVVAKKSEIESKKTMLKHSGATNQAFEHDNDYECLESSSPTRTVQVKSVEDDATSQQPAPVETLSVKRFNRKFDNKYLSSGNIYSSLTSKNILSQSVKSDNPVNLKNKPRLDREQIERQFYEYTLECHRRLNELFAADSLSSDSGTTELEPIHKHLTYSSHMANKKEKIKMPVFKKSRTVENEQIWHI